VHNLLHRVPALWELHKVHHSSRSLDWLANWRFHVLEIVVYRALLYVPLGLLGANGQALFAVGVWNTFMGHYTHANTRIGLGPFRYLLNSPRMHLWHHTHASAGPVNKNFGIGLSVWDWVFRTAYIPEHDPSRLGFQGGETFAETWWGQTLAPFRALVATMKKP